MGNMTQHGSSPFSTLRNIQLSCFLAGILFSVPLLNSQTNLSPQQDSYSMIALFEFHVPGAYRLLMIDQSGMCEYVQFQRAIQEFRSGHLDSTYWDNLKLQLLSRQFSELENKYDVYPIDSSLPPVVYEDTYYWLNVSIENQSKEIISHEHAAPAILKQVVNSLFSHGRELPDQSRDSLFLLVTEPEIAAKIRWLKPADRPVIEFDTETLSPYSVLKKAVLKPGWLYPIQSLEAAEIKEFFTGGATSFEIMCRGKKFVVCFLRRDKNNDK